MATKNVLSIKVPESSIAGSPPEERGVARDGTHLMVSTILGGDIEHTVFSDLGDYLERGDLVVTNTSATIPACVEAETSDGMRFELRLSQKYLFDLWVAELNIKGGDFSVFAPGDILSLPGGAKCILHTPLKVNYSPDSRLWVLTVLPDGNSDVLEYLYEYAHPHHFYYHDRQWPLEYFQNVYSSEPGSAEFPCAGRGFTDELLGRLASKGIHSVGLVLHAGTNNEGNIPAHPEFFRIPLDTARAINAAHDGGHQVVAVGTTVVRALETVVDRDGYAHPGEGWTHLTIRPETRVRSVDALLTTLHDPETTHIGLLEAFCSAEHLDRAYAEALARGYLWHEFGDSHLILRR